MPCDTYRDLYGPGMTLNSATASHRPQPKIRMCCILDSMPSLRDGLGVGLQSTGEKEVAPKVGPNEDRLPVANTGE